MKRLVLGIIVIVTTATCVRLGFWQLDRLASRRARNAEVTSRAGLPVLDANGLGEADALADRRAEVRGVFDLERQVIEVLRTSGGVPGIHVVTPLVLENGSAVLVQRGWLPSPDGQTADLTPYRVGDTVAVAGVLLAPRPTPLPAGRAWPLTVRDADPASLGAVYPYDLAPWLLRLERGPVVPGLRVIQPPEPTDGPHLGYALQWFSFAAVALIGGSILLFGSPGRREPHTAVAPR